MSGEGEALLPSCRVTLSRISIHLPNLHPDAPAARSALRARMNHVAAPDLLDAPELTPGLGVGPGPSPRGVDIVTADPVRCLEAAAELGHGVHLPFWCCDQEELLGVSPPLPIPALVRRTTGAPTPRLLREREAYFLSDDLVRGVYLGPLDAFEAIVSSTHASGRYVLLVFRLAGTATSQRIGHGTLPAMPHADHVALRHGTARLFRIQGLSWSPIWSVFDSPEKAAWAATAQAPAGQYVIGVLARVIAMF